MAAFPLLLLAMFVVMVLVPQRRRMRQHQALLSGLSPGDRILTAGGLYGVVLEIDNDTVVISVARGSTLHITRRAIARRIASDDSSAPSAAALGVSGTNGRELGSAAPDHDSNLEDPQ